LGYLPAVVGVAGRTRRGVAEEISRAYDIPVGAADAGLRLFAERLYPARPKVAVLAAKAQFAKTAMRGLGLGPIPHRLDSAGSRDILQFNI